MADDFFENQVLPEELYEIARRREELGFATPVHQIDNSTGNSVAHGMCLFGVSFSGGGIRSATLNLGILQGLSQLGYLPLIDYLSTVSGGGYIGSWLHGLILRHKGNPETVARLLSPAANPIPESPDRDPVTFLRKYSNYLAPSPGGFSADTWVIASIWIRNVLLNQIILLPALAAVVLSLILIGAVSQLNFFGAGLNAVALVASGVLLFGAVVLMAGNLDEIARLLHPNSKIQAVHWWEKLVEFLRRAVEKGNKFAERCTSFIPWIVFAASVLLGCSGLTGTTFQRIVLAVALTMLYILFQGTGGFYRCYQDRHGGSRAGAVGLAVLMIPAVVVVSEGLIILVWNWSSATDVWQKIAFAPPLISLSLIAGVALLVGLMGVDYPDAAREWLARMGTMIALICAAWAGLYTIGVFGPAATLWVLGHYGKTGITAIGAWIVATASGVLGARSAQTNGSEQTSVLRRLLPLAPGVFMVGYLLAISLGVHLAIPQRPDAILADKYAAPAVATTPTTNYDITVRQPVGDTRYQIAVGEPSQPGGFTKWALDVEAEYYRALDFGHLYLPEKAGTPRYHVGKQALVQTVPQVRRILFLVFALAGSILVSLLAASRFNINEFSMHHFYKNRLVRCYLGATNAGERNPNRFTGFDPKDDFPISELLPSSKEPYLGPLAIINTALNLNTGSELATQERKATSFAFTPVYSGFNPAITREDRREQKKNKDFSLEGYCETRGYLVSPNGPDIGTVTAISGAAANPNCGFHTSGALAFLLTVFDARLGWWVGNPRWSIVHGYAGPAFALKYLFAELFGQTTGRSKFVNLSDGGHFDNLGLYELVRRRCRYIVIGDAEQDPDLTFGSLGQAIRMCRADFGVEIEINPDPIRVVGDRFSKTHCVVGKIQYPEKDPNGREVQGWLLYLKSSLTGNEPADVVEYHSRFHEFPHQSTADQFFTESQFESYRRLGLHIVMDAFEGVTQVASPDDLETAFKDLQSRWYAPIPVSPESATRLANAYSDLIKRFANNPNLYYLGKALAPEMGVTGDFNNECFGFGLELVQLMENVYTEFELAYGVNQANPRIHGWMQVFRRWCQCPCLYGDVWLKVRDDYNPIFRSFVEGLHNGRG